MNAQTSPHTVILAVLDGFGIGPPGPGNAIQQAHPPTLESLVSLYPHTQLEASGESVGLPPDEAGNTEVGHTNLGAGKIVYQNLPRIDMAIQDGTFFKNDVFLKAKDHIANTGGSLHLVGLVGEQHVHSSVNHLYALLKFAKEQAVSNVFIHAITDGRDSPPQAAATYLAELGRRIEEIGVGKIASVMGRYYAMDRDKRWSRVEKAYSCLLNGSESRAAHWKQVVDDSYAKGVTDEFIEPTALYVGDQPIGRIRSGDSVIFYNFRIDRPRELTKAFVLPDFEERGNESAYDPYATKYLKSHIAQETNVEQPFQRSAILSDLFFVTMTEYERGLAVEVAFPTHSVNYPLGRILAEKNLSQLRVSESEKERFVTYYFNGLREAPFPREERNIVPSPKVATYDLQPEMSAVAVTDTVLKGLYSQQFPFILVNYANPDMVGHTGNIEAAKEAILSVDACVQKLVAAVTQLDATLIITADHGNVEQMIDPVNNQSETEHTSNMVPCIIVSKKLRGNHTQLQSGILADIAPTILYLLRIPRPEEMTGRNLLEEIGGEV